MEGGGWGLASPRSTYREHWCQWDGRLEGSFVALLGLFPFWAVIKSRSWCEAFCWGRGGLPPTVRLDVSPRRDVTKRLLFVFSFFLPRDKWMTHRCSESQVVIVNLLGIKHEIRLSFDVLHWYGLLRIALGLREQAIGEGDRNLKEVISSKKAGVKVLEWILFGFYTGTLWLLAGRILHFNTIFRPYNLGNYENYPQLKKVYFQ